MAKGLALRDNQVICGCSMSGSKLFSVVGESAAQDDQAQDILTDDIKQAVVSRSVLLWIFLLCASKVRSPGQ